MGAVRTKALADLRRRRLQTVVTALVLFLATAAATLALDVLVESQSPFENAFAAANGAHLVITYDSSVDASQLAATARAEGVSDAIGPWPFTTAGLDLGTAGKYGPDLALGQIAGRASPDTTIDRMTLSAGRWWQAPGEIVVSQSFAQRSHKSLGDSLVVIGATPTKDGYGIHVGPSPSGGPASPSKTLTIVGVAGSISTPSVDGWTSPADVAALDADGHPEQQMLYRVTPAATAADLVIAARSVTAGVPPAAVLGTQTYLAEAADVNRTAAIFVPILLAFSLFALFAAAFIIANVVGGVVLANYREIGVMKAIGFTPGQVTMILLGQILVPVAIGTGAGIALGTIGSQPILAQTARSFGLPAPFTLSLPVTAGVLALALGTAILAAVGPAWRAGQLSAVSAITRGTTPTTRAGGGRLQRLFLDLPVRAPLRLGFGAGVAHALRATMTLGALVVGVAAVVFALGLNSSLRLVAADLIRDQASPIRVNLGSPAASASQISTAIAADPRTAKWVALADAPVTVPGLSGPIPFVAYQGDASWLGYALISGRWFGAPAEAVAPTNFFTQTGLHVGDRVTVAAAGNPFSVTLVGEIFDQARENRDDLLLRGDWADLAGVEPGLTPVQWEVQPKAATDLAGYRSDLGDATNHAVSVQVVTDSATDEGFLLFEGVIGLLGFVLVAISLGGVFNTVLLETRQRTRETAVLKAIGMAPRQTLLMVVASVLPVGLAAGVMGVPLGILAQRIVLAFMAQAAIKSNLPPGVFDTFPLPFLIGLGLSGLAIGAIGAYLPGQRAARARIAPVLQTE